MGESKQTFTKENVKKITFPYSYEEKWHETFVKSNVNRQILKLCDQ